MKIIANSAWLESAKAEKSLEIANDADVAELVASGALQGIEQVVLHFPKFTDGRAYTQAVLLRRRYRFQGDICATGDVLIDQLVHMHRSGFTSAVWSKESKNGTFGNVKRNAFESFKLAKVTLDVFGSYCIFNHFFYLLVEWIDNQSVCPRDH